MFTIGLTGGIGSGKSTAANFFRSQGIEVIDLDQLARDVVEPGGPALNAITERFGSDTLNKDGTLDRKKLGEIIFSSAGEKQWLEELLHPLINAKKENRLMKAKSPYAVIEIPLLIENNRQDSVDRVLVIDADREAQISRAKNRGDQTPEQIEKIIQSQASSKERRKIAHDWVTNNGTEEELIAQLQVLHSKYLQLAEADKIRN